MYLICAKVVRKKLFYRNMIEHKQNILDFNFQILNLKIFPFQGVRTKGKGGSKAGHKKHDNDLNQNQGGLSWCRQF